MTQQFILIGTVEFVGDRDLLLEGRVEVYDRDLPSLEQRGASHQLLGQSPIDGNFGFRIEFTDEQFRRAEGKPLHPLYRRLNKIRPDLSFRVVDATGQALTITGIIAQQREYGPDQIIFNVPPNLEGIEIRVELAPESGNSEYERLVAAIAPVLEDLPLADLTDADGVFLINELGLEQQLDTQQQIQWLRRSALLSRQTDAPIEAFYGWGRKNLPADFTELAGVALEKLPSIVKELLAQEDAVLRKTLLIAIEENFIPGSLRERLDEIMAQIEQLKMEQNLLLARRFIGKLLDERSREPLVGLTVQGVDLDAGQAPKNLGRNVSNNQGVFSLNYSTPPIPAGADPNQIKRRLRLQVVINPATQAQVEIEVQAAGDQDILDIPVSIPIPPEPESHQLNHLAPALAVQLSPDLLPFLADKNINTLADIRKAGGISRLEGLPVAADDPAIQLLEAHADLSRISTDIQVNGLMIQNRYNSVAAIAQASRPDFVGTIRDQVGDFKAAQLQVSARAQTQFLNNMMFQKFANQVNGAEHDPLLAERMRCQCRDCEAAVSPLAYLSDLLNYVTGNIKNRNAPISAANLAAIFQQPFDLPASCEAVDAQIRQVRLCVEVLRGFLGVRPLADPDQEIALVKAETDYLLAAYTTVLTKIGTNYAELRLARTAEPSLRQALAERLGIDLSHLNAFFLDPNAALLTEASLEQVFGLADTTRAPFTAAPVAELQTWRLEYLRTLWKSQDFPADQYEDGQNAAALKQLPAGVVFAPPLDAKFSYDAERQQLVCQGAMTPDERSTLLALDPNLLYQQAVTQLFQASQRLPIIDPDLIGPDDFRRPFLKVNLGDPDQAFDLWKNRRDWVDDRLQVVSGLTKRVPGQAQPVPDIAAMFAVMYQPVSYGPTSAIAWASTTPETELENLRNRLTQGIEVTANQFRLRDDLNLTVESFTRLMAIAAKAKAWETDPRSEPVKDDEWREVYSILIQAQKVKLFATWRKEESDAGIQFDPQTFWMSLRQPQEGEWPPIRSAHLPLIDPATLKLKDLAEPIVGERAITLWQARQTRLEQIPWDLATERQNNGFDALLSLALGHHNPGDALQHDLTTLKTELSDPDPAIVASATGKITNDLHLRVESFKRLLAIKAKNDDPDPAKKPTAAEWAELYAILAPARKVKHEFPLWIAEEQDPWNTLKAKLPRWRSSGETRQFWQQALRVRSKPAIIDPDLMGPGDLKNPVPGNPAFDLWQARAGEINTQLAQLAAEPQTPAGLDTRFQAILGISMAQLQEIAADQEKGNIISDRLAQLSLENAEFNYLRRIAKLATQAQPILDLEWENLYSLLVQVWKRRQSAQWLSAEKAQTILLSSDLFQIPPPVPLQFPAKERTVADVWRSPKVAYQDWQDGLQSRIDQEQTTIQALKEAVSSAEETTLPLLRDALILAITLPGDLEAKAKWVTENLLIDAKMSGCSLTTRVAQSIETLQSLILALRTGQLEDLYRTFQLNLENFDEKWKWLGSYASWRAAMFVFLYPENILQPSLRKWQTPAFQALIKDTGGNRKLTPADACLKARKYSEYLQDIATLRVEASCTSRTRLTKGDGCSKTDDGYRCLFYLFGRGGITGKVYWSAYDLLAPENYTQTFWREVEIEDFGNIIGILGAVPYQIDPKQRYIFLFGKKQVGQVERLVCAKYDLEHPLTWSSKLLTLDVPDKENRFEAVVKQTEFENEPPHLVFRVYNPRTVSISSISTVTLTHKEMKINVLGDDWESEVFKPLYAIPTRKLLSMVGDKNDRNSFRIFQEDNQGNIDMIPFSPGTSFYYSQSGITVKDEDRDRFQANLVFKQTFYGKYVGVFCLGQFSPFLLILPSRFITGIPYYELYVINPFPNRTYKITSPFPLPFDFVDGRIWVPGRASLIPTWGITEYGNDQKKRLVFRPDNAPTEIFQLLKNDNPLRFTLIARQSVTPLLSGPFEIPNRLSESELQIRRGLVQAAYQENFPLGVAAYTYLEEAYYFVPIHLALALHRSGEYLAALDLLRTVYDYTTDVNKRKIYHGLTTEESIANTYKRSPYWLLDPLNPHAIAATRQNTYTRFTLLTIIRCLLDYADAEFTQDTAESNPRARRFYLTAQELLKTPELQQSRNQCEEIIGVLDDIAVADDRWQVTIHQIKGELNAIPDPQRLQPVVNQIQQVLITGAPFEQRFASAKAILAQAIAALPPAPNLTSVMQENESFSHAVQRSMLSDASLTAALESVSTIATEDFQRNVSMVTGISTSRLALRAVDLPWLREPIPRFVSSEQSQAAEKLTIARRDAARLDVLAPTNMATLAGVAARQPMTAINQFAQVPVVHMPQLISSFCIPPNPLLKSLRLRAELNLYKLRTCRNIAGMKRQLEPYAAPTDTTTGLPTIGAGGQLLLPGVVRLQPTLYRYPVLIERAKQLVQLAGQIEAALLASLEKRDNEAFTLLKARQELGLAQAGIRLQSLRLKEANDGTKLAELRKKRTEVQVQTYTKWMQSDLNQYEWQMIAAYIDIESAKRDELDWNMAVQIAQATIGVAAAGISGAVAAGNAAIALTASLVGRNNVLKEQFTAEKESQIAALYANLENRKQEWQFQLELSNQDVIISDQEIVLASDRVEIVTQEKAISELQASNAKDTIEFLSTKFTSVNLYDWMSGILEEVYRFFLQQATSMAKLSENQLAFERQEVPPAYIQADYWTAPSAGAGSSSLNAPVPDRKGLTGSARLLQDIYQLDQYAFNTNKRKLQLSKTLSLAILAPAEFQRFRETGVMLFTTPMEMFDRGFPGHYLRLIRRVRTSVIALIPPTQGIHATLSTTGLSRTVIGPDIFQTVSIRRDPEFVALTSPVNSTGMFELEPQQTDMLLPFEGNGVDSTWEFRMPKAANQFDYRTIADVLITIEYTALNSFDYHQQVIQTLKPTLSADRPFSFRNQFADQWYDLHNPEQTKEPMKVRFRTFREDFPPNLDNLKVQQVFLYFASAEGKSFEGIEANLRFTPQGDSALVGGKATAIDGIISTRRGNAASWTTMIGKYPFGEWELALPNTEDIKNRFKSEGIQDILLVITYSGRTPEWPG